MGRHDLGGNSVHVFYDSVAQGALGHERGRRYVEQLGARGDEAGRDVGELRAVEVSVRGVWGGGGGEEEERGGGT